MSYAPTQERCHLDHMADIDTADHLERYAFASKFVKGKRVLDIASGTGYGSEALRKAGALSVIGVDVSREAVSEATRVYSGDYRVGSMLDFDEQPFDVIVSFETIEHIDDYETGLRNLRRLLKQGGTMVMSTPNRPVNSRGLKLLSDKPRNAFHVREFWTWELVKSLKEAGFSSIELYGQKMRWTMEPRPLAIAYAAFARVFLPSHFSAKVLPLTGNLEPRYTVFVCK